ncbi:MAG: alpha/beta hydrolase [Chitinophagaceae bacterium]|nr:alpha/beta hydrolase [Chitinophagaceae bacterium]
MIRIFAFCIIIKLLFTTDVAAQEVMPLYDKVPNSIPSVDKETSVVRDGILRITKVSVPTITIYHPTNPGAGRTAVIICPGGGYGMLAASHEGSDIAHALNQWGITAFVLKYRLPDDSIMIKKSIGPLQDAQRALQLVRLNANRWNINSERIGIMGFSAGGHLAATASTHFGKAVIDNPDNTILRPAFSILIYPVISFFDSLSHIGSRNNLLGKGASHADILDFSNESAVTPMTPIAFLVHSGDDRTVKVANSIAYYEALVRNGVKSELHLYPSGGHGYGMNNKTTPDVWMERLKNWLKSNSLLKNKE